MKTTPPHFYTLTGNLLAEDTFTFGAWTAGQTQRAAGASFQVGGKGINVAKMLNRLAVPNTALCFAGGPPGFECTTWLRAQGFVFAAFPAQSSTRRGFVVRSERAAETTFLGPDVPPDAIAVQACADYLDAQPDGHVLALCGSMPGWNGAAYDGLRAAVERWQNRGIVVADTYGDALEWTVRQPLALIKINRTEFDSLVDGVNVSSDLEARLSRAAAEWPVLAWVVTDGPRDLWMCEKGGPACADHASGRA